MLFLKLDELSLRHQRIIIDTGDHVGYTDKAIYNWKGMRNLAKKLNILPFNFLYIKILNVRSNIYI